MVITSHLSPRSIRPLGLLIAALVIAASSYVATGLKSDPSDPPSRTPTSIEGAAAVSAGNALGSIAELDTSIATWSAKTALDDNDYISSTNLGILYLGRARLSSNLDDYSRAAAAGRRALAAYPAYVPARALDATVRYATHDFAGALAAARALLADEPGDADALAVVGDASLELGRIDDARSTYARLGSIIPGPPLDVRLARLAFVTGDPARALQIARRARAAALDDGTVDPAFYDFQLGEFARLAGDATTARTAYEAALASRPAHLGALVSLARVDAAEERLADAETRLRRAVAIAPQPEALALLGDVLTLRGDTSGAGTQYDTVRLTGRLGELAGAVYDRQLLQFELDHGGASTGILEHAQAGAESRPDAGGGDLVAWALHRLGRDDEAWAASERARSGGIVEARILFHAGAIAIARGDRSSGDALLRQALGLGPALDPADRAEARRLLGG
jgi:tetratricopeptide (TPR) repeat protein